GGLDLDLARARPGAVEQDVTEEVACALLPRVLLEREPREPPRVVVEASRPRASGQHEQLLGVLGVLLLELPPVALGEGRGSRERRRQRAPGPPLALPPPAEPLADELVLGVEEERERELLPRVALAALDPPRRHVV